MAEQEIAQVLSYYVNIGVAALILTKKLKAGDQIHMNGYTTDFTQTVKSLQIEHEKVEKVSKGADVGIKMDDKVRKGDKVYKV